MRKWRLSKLKSLVHGCSGLDAGDRAGARLLRAHPVPEPLLSSDGSLSMAEADLQTSGSWEKHAHNLHLSPRRQLTDQVRKGQWRHSSGGEGFQTL